MENRPQGQVRPILISQDKPPLAGGRLGCGTPASSTQSSVSQLGIGHPVTVPCHGCVSLCSILLPLYGVISHPT